MSRFSSTTFISRSLGSSSHRLVFMTVEGNYIMVCPCMYGSRGGGGAGGPDPLENYKNIGFLCNTGP